MKLSTKALTYFLKSHMIQEIGGKVILMPVCTNVCTEYLLYASIRKMMILRNTALKSWISERGSLVLCTNQKD
jgi:hypothetical protein